MLTIDQWNGLFLKMSTVAHFNVEELKLWQVDLPEEVNAEEMSIALARAKNLELGLVDLSWEQWKNLLEKLPVENRCDKIYLRLSRDTELDGVCSEIMAKGLGFVKHLELAIDLEDYYWEDLLPQILNHNRMKFLDVPYRASRVVPEELWENVLKTVAHVRLEGFPVQ